MSVNLSTQTLQVSDAFAIPGPKISFREPKIEDIQGFSVTMADFGSSYINPTINNNLSGANGKLWRQYPNGIINTTPVIQETGTLNFVDKANSPKGSGALRVDMDQGSLYLEMNNNNEADLLYTREVISNQDQLGLTWEEGKVNRHEIYLLPSSDFVGRDDGGQHGRGLQFGTYFRGSNGARNNNESGGGNHYYHQYSLRQNNAWWKCVADEHPGHIRGLSGGLEHGNRPYPIVGDKRYYDLMTRFYWDFQHTPNFTQSSEWWADAPRFYQEINIENEDQVYAPSISYNANTQSLMFFFATNKNEVISYEVRYAYQDPHLIGFDNCLVPPNNILTKQFQGGYNIMRYINNTIDHAVNDKVYYAVRPVGSSLFKRISIETNLVA